MWPPNESTDTKLNLKVWEIDKRSLLPSATDGRNHSAPPGPRPSGVASLRANRPSLPICRTESGLSGSHPLQIKKPPKRGLFNLVPRAGIEPARPCGAQDFKSCASTNFATPAHIGIPGSNIANASAALKNKKPPDFSGGSLYQNTENYLTAFLNSIPGRNLGVLEAAILIVAPV